MSGSALMSAVSPRLRDLEREGQGQQVLLKLIGSQSTLKDSSSMDISTVFSKLLFVKEMDVQ